MYWLYRIYHFVLKLIVILIDVPNPKLHLGFAGLKEALLCLNLNKNDAVLVVTDTTLLSLEKHKELELSLIEQGLQYHYYSAVLPNPTIDNVESGLALFQQFRCKAIIALGGGSVIDCAKLIGARAVKPHKRVEKLKGLFKILKKLPANIAIPTTAGTGSETTVAAVVNDPKTNKKYAATDFCLVPHHAVLIPELTASMPENITATTAIDALTHAIEALLSVNCMRFSREKALSACKAIFDNLPKVKGTPNDMAAREQLLLASHYAGQAFTRTSVGYVHAISHQLSARYGTAHGIANTVLLLPVLHWYGARVHTVMAEIAIYCGFADASQSKQEQAQLLLKHIENLLMTWTLPSKLAEITEADIAMLAKAALKEAHPDYPVPCFMDLDACQAILKQISVTKA
ncbi:iron-containing alcohol dehydrogenase [Pseudoalteromonas sp. T1lg65]|uniref:iron-containing alcohol dehydrogenase n=1 Tax=Pseudoalteromonas sp. T1lg65 TaxID=2077101 RepID=UPI003F79ADE2